ncbi:HU family DNA-binding protein [Candidatus Poribacteria bacterium]|nr:HU family DNA-binding protein [Candidatus Poribacteria bacterium]
MNLPRSRRSIETVTRCTLSREVSERLGVSQRHADRILAEAFSALTHHLLAREAVKLEDFGKFEVNLRKGWNGRHPATGRRVLIRDRLTVAFRPGKGLKRRVAGKSSSS